MLEFVGKAEIYFTSYQMKTFHFSLLLYIILKSTNHPVGISYVQNFWGEMGGRQSPGNKLGLWLLYILYDFFFRCNTFCFGSYIHSPLDVIIDLHGWVSLVYLVPFPKPRINLNSQYVGHCKILKLTWRLQSFRV